MRAALVFFCAMTAFLLGLYLIRKMRKNISQECDLSDEATPSLEQLPLHLYNTVIQQLKQQKHELLVQSQTEQNRARTSESFSQSVLSNLSCGVLVFGSNGLVKTANPAAKAILGFASTTGMSAADIFREAAIYSSAVGVVYPSDAPKDRVRVADEIALVLQENSKRRDFKGEYQSPAGEKRYLQMTVSRVPTADGGLLGVACLINDLSELEGIRKQQELHGEISAEMALQLRTSLTTISGFAQQLANNRDPELAKDIAMDIAHEAARLDRSIGGFLTAKSGAARAAAPTAK